MANKLYDEAAIQDIADAIREKNGTTNTYVVAQMGNAVRAIQSSGGDDSTEPLAEFDQQNPLLTEYLAESAGYSPDDYTTSVALSYAYDKPDYVKCHPVGHTITIKQDGELHLTDGGEVLVKTVEAGDHVLINTTPDKVAHWWLTVDGAVKQSGTIRPTGYVRMISTPAINVRDLGGWNCDGGKVKYGKIFRGGLLSEADRDVLVGQLGIRHDLDLRSKSNNGGITASPLGSEIYYTTPDTYPWYTLNYAEWGTILRTIFDAAAHNEPLIFHCAAGSDRTGTVACIVEALLGMDQSDIDRDYEISTFGISLDEGDYEARRRTDTNWQALVEEISSVAVGDTFRDKVVNWVGSLGFTADEINAFRHSMIDGTPSDIALGEDTEPESDYQMVEWVRIVDINGSAEHAKHHIHSAVKWNQCNKIVCKVACAASSHETDIIFSAWTGAATATTPYIATRNDENKFTYNSGLNNYAVTPNDIPIASVDAIEYTMTFTSTSTDDMRLGGWIDTQYSHTHDWYYIQLYHDDTLLAEYLPCYRKADSVIGFLETVSGDFCLNGYNDSGFTTRGNDI